MATFRNQATLSYTGGTTESNVVTGELVEVISAHKTAVSGSYEPGGKVVYIVSIVNSGATSANGLVLTDNLGKYTVGSQQFVPLAYVPGSVHYLVNGTERPAPTVTAGPPLVITGINIPAGGNAVIIYEATVKGSAPRGPESSIVNTAKISGEGMKTITVCARVYAKAAVDLTISKSLCPRTVTGNEEITYTFVIQNSGNLAAVAADGIVVSDKFNPILRNITVTLDGTPLEPQTGYTYNTATGAFATVAGKITVPAATFSQNMTTGDFTVTPGVAVLTVTGTI